MTGIPQWLAAAREGRFAHHQLSGFAKPTGKRGLDRVLRSGNSRRIVEIGVGDGQRAKQQGSRLTVRLGIGTSADTLLREIRSTAVATTANVRVVGVDDWALRRGQRYGPVPNPTDRGRCGSKHCLLTDAGGVPLVLDTAPANQHDVTTLLPLVVEMPAVAGKPGRPKQKPKALVADKAFDDDSLRDLLRWLGITPLIPHRGDDAPGLGQARWFIERTISWLHQFRRLRIRWDRRPEIHQAFLSLAATVICYRICNRR